MMQKLIVSIGVLALLVFGCAASARAEFADVNDAGTLGNAPASPVGVSDDGRFVFFSSTATNLVTGAPTGTQGYLRDRTASTTTQPVPNSTPVAISATGRFLLVSQSGLFVFDRQGSSMERVDVSSAGVPANASASATLASISSDGRFVAFSSTASNLVSGDTNGSRDVFVRDRQTATTTLASTTGTASGTGDSAGGAISSDGGVVTFTSTATNLVAGDENADSDLFARTSNSAATELVSVDSSGRQDVSAPPTQCAQAVSSSTGRFVAFSCGAPNLAAPALGNDQRTDHAYVRDRAAGTTVRADVDDGGSVLSAGGQLLTPTIAGDGRRAVFWANATFPGKLVLWDAVPRGRARVLDVRGQAPLLSQDGRTLAYQDIPTSASTAHVGVLALPASVADTEPPVVSCAAPDAVFHAANVTLTCSAGDAGSGLADGGTSSFTLSTEVGTGSETAAASTGTRRVCDVAGNCRTAGPLGPIRIDRRVPAVACDGAPAAGTALTGNVVASCSATDGGSGLVDQADAGFSLRTVVPGGKVVDAASTGTRVVCDAVGNCAATGPFGPFAIDRSEAPPEDRDTDVDGEDDDIDRCPITAGTCVIADSAETVGKSIEDSTIDSAGALAVATCAPRGKKAPLTTLAPDAAREVGPPAGTALKALARESCSANLATAVAAAAAEISQATSRAAVPASVGVPYVAPPAAGSTDYDGLSKRCRNKKCRSIVDAAGRASAGARSSGEAALGVFASRARLKAAQQAGDGQASILQAAAVRTYEGQLADAQDTRTAGYSALTRGLRISGVPQTLPGPTVAATRTALATRGQTIPGIPTPEITGAGVDPDVVAAALSDAVAGAPGAATPRKAKEPVATAALVTKKKPKSGPRRELSGQLDFDPVAHVIIALARAGSYRYSVMGRMLAFIDDARSACTSATRGKALDGLQDIAKGTDAAALVDRAVITLKDKRPSCA